MYLFPSITTFLYLLISLSYSRLEALWSQDRASIHILRQITVFSLHPYVSAIKSKSQDTFPKHDQVQRNARGKITAYHILSAKLGQEKVCEPFELILWFSASISHKM